MILIDTNIIVSLLVSSTTDHSIVTKWFQSVTDSKCTTSINLGEILRLLSHPRVFAAPATLEAAINLVTDWIKAADIEIVQEKENWLEELRSLSSLLPDLRGNDVFDARIALCARYNGVKKIATKDSDFAKFSFIEVVNPNSIPKARPSTL